MIKKLLEAYRSLRSNKRTEPLIDTFLFMFITLAIHFTYNYWAIKFQYRIFGVQVLTPALFDWATEHVFRHTRLVVDLLLTNNVVERTFTFENNYSLWIVPSCSGIKQMLQVSLLFILYPGPWRQKIWFIPLGMVIIHITNVLRLAGLCVVMANWPQHWQFSHDYPARIIFYVVIFFLWVIWNDRFHHRKSKADIKTE